MCARTPGRPKKRIGAMRATCFLAQIERATVCSLIRTLRLSIECLPGTVSQTPSIYGRIARIIPNAPKMDRPAIGTYHRDSGSDNVSLFIGEVTIHILQTGMLAIFELDREEPEARCPNPQLPELGQRRRTLNGLSGAA